MGISSDFFRCRIRDKEVIILAQQVFHDYSTILPVSQIRTVLPYFRLFFHGWLLSSSRVSLGSTYYYVVFL